ncbi:pantothenate synthetase [Thermaurantimonas aggregans]|uniref:Pantothenate synthetase n=1 Tax=Thermaurantimonas aggregans TaxID=2173829 RepID=A0A401XKV5_9FLAO|nr:pantoate--beta-alanine ligase [Thermaurantimonas aggregans]MCX8148190.1 pantoate--beta-alanine ligase [Thermaurantimonas aggregans]GCD77620.1 pantothenate synthetase [Thermaurantimonas aggregans]
MILANTSKQLNEALSSGRKQGLKIGFVPTMGALHQGHVSLIDKARQSTDVVVVSVFVNPTQFNNPEDLQKYPRTVDADISLCKTSGCDVMFLPDVSEIYPEGLQLTKVDLPLGNLGKVMEAAYRPGHFEGVISVVYRLFSIVRPDVAFFGEKDYQQLLIVTELAKKYFPNIVIHPVETVRLTDGLALSSRNLRLDEQSRAQASHIYQGFLKVRDFLNDNLSWNQENCFKIFENHLNRHAPILKIEYFLIADQRNLFPASPTTPKEELRAFAAVYANNIRLIDNMKLF